MTLSTALVVACSPDKTTSAAPTTSENTVTMLTVAPSDTTLERGATVVFTTVARRADGSVITGLPTTWATSSAAVASVSAAGVVTAVAPGSASISAVVDGKTALAQVRVNEALQTPAVFWLAVSAPSVAIVQGGGDATVTIDVVREDGFAAPISLAVSGAPPGLSVTLDQSGDRATLAMRSSTGVPTQHYTLTITGAATNRPPQRVSFQTIVSAPPGSGTVTLDYSQCLAEGDAPVWAAAQDGDGAWFQLTGDKGVFRFTATSARVGYVLAWDGDFSGKYLDIQYMTRAEATASTRTACLPNGNKTVFGGVAGLSDPPHVAVFSMGSSFGGLLNPTSFRLFNVARGKLDLVAYRSTRSGPGPADRIVILRDRDVAPNGSVGTVDFDGTDAFAPISAALNVPGAESDEELESSMMYLTGAGCRGGFLYNSTAITGNAITMVGVPAERQRSTDFHSVWLSASSSSTGRSVAQTFHSMGDRTLTLGPRLPAPAIISLPGPFPRLQATLTIPPEYRGAAAFEYWVDGLAGTVNITATSGWLAGEPARLAVPDFSTVSGWHNDLAPPLGALLNWNASVQSPHLGSGGGCVEGATARSAWVWGAR